MGNSEQLEQRLLPASTRDKNSPSAVIAATATTTTTTAAPQSEERGKNENKDAKSRKSKIKKNKVADKAAKSSGGSNKKKGKTKGGGDKENEKLSQQITHVQFSFDDYAPPDDDVVKQQLPTIEPKTIASIDEPDRVTNELQIREDGDPVIDLTTVDKRGRYHLGDDDDQNGNYDELPPVIRIDDNSNYETSDMASGIGPENEITALTRSSESIPFIDEGEHTPLRRSPRHQRNHHLAVVQQQHHHQYPATSSTSSSQLSLTPYYQQPRMVATANQYHHPHYHHHLHHPVPQQSLPHHFESRIITLIPKNFESHNLITPPPPPTAGSIANSAVGNTANTTNIVPMQTFLPVKLSHQIGSSGLGSATGGGIGASCSLAARPIHILPRIDEQHDELHKFQYYYNPGFKMCQICHLYLHVCPAIKCYECEFVCHRQCLHKVGA